MILTAPFAKESRDPPLSTLHGITLSSVCSLATTPTPLLSFNLHLPSHTSLALHARNGTMAIHMMPPSYTGAKLARIFASGIKVEKSYHSREISFKANKLEQKDGEIFHERTTPFAHIFQGNWVEWPLDDTLSLPLLKEAERVLICKKRLVMQVDNHEVWAVEVQDILNYNLCEPTGGLLYYNRKFHQVGDPLTENRYVPLHRVQELEERMEALKQQRKKRKREQKVANRRKARAAARLVQ